MCQTAAGATSLPQTTLVAKPLSSIESARAKAKRASSVFRDAKHKKTWDVDHAWDVGCTCTCNNKTKNSTVPFVLCALSPFSAFPQ